MLSLGWSEITIIVIIVIMIVGPKELPNIIKQLGYFSKKIKSLSREFNTTINNLAKEAEIDQVQKDIKKISNLDPKDEILKHSKIKSEFKEINTTFNKLNKNIQNLDEVENKENSDDK